MFFQTTALAAFAASASAHMILSSPAPFAFEDSGNRQAPLAPKDWPCKQPGGTYAVETMNTVAAGGSLDVQLMGGATHGGGSCQFSITTDAKPTKESQWKVLHSQIHGCQGGDGESNMSNSAEDMGNPVIPVKIPEGLPAGQYTFAWSWLNKHGNREFYMNCAPLEVTGGSDGSVEEVLGGLPDMFVANLPSTTTTADENPEGLPICTVAEGQDFMYPNPGESVTTAEGAAPGNSFDGPGCAAQNAYGAGAGKLGSPSAGSGGETPAAPETAAPETEAPADPAPVAPAPVAPAPVAPAPAAPAPAAPASGNCTPCDAAGSLVCIGSDSFGICDNGCAVPQKLAAGTTCSNGAIARRSLKFPRGTLHNRHADLHKRSSAL